MKRMLLVLAMIALFALAPLALAQDTTTTETIVIAPTEIGVVFNPATGELEDPLPSGTHTINPLTQVVTIYSLAQQVYAAEDPDAIIAVTTDGQQIEVTVSVIFAINPDEVAILFRSWGDDYYSALLRPVVRGIVRDVASTFDAVQLLMNQSAFAQELFSSLAGRLGREGLVVSDALVTEVRFSTAFTDAVEQRMAAEQRVQAAQLEAEQARMRAQAERDARILQAQAEAETAIIAAQAELEILRLYAELFAQNPQLLQVEFLRRLADNVQIWVVSEDSPFLFGPTPDGE
jgi:prohibitin 1